MAKVFISYRRSDSAIVSRRIYDRLVMHFGKSEVFMDVDNIPPGVRFSDYILTSLGQCVVELIIIGPRWLSAMADDGTRRLDNPQDLVRIEVDMGVTLGLTLIPVLVAGMSMPTQASLPTSIRELSEFQAISVRNDPDFGQDMDRVMAAVERAVATDSLPSEVNLFGISQLANPSALQTEQSASGLAASSGLAAPRAAPPPTVPKPQLQERAVQSPVSSRVQVPLSSSVLVPTRQEHLASASQPESASPAVQSGKSKWSTGNPIAALPVRLVAVAAVILLLAGGWDFTLGPYAQMQAATQRLQSAITNVQHVVSKSGQLDPPSALASLSQARAQILSDLGNTQADSQVRQTAEHLLATQLVPAVQNAVGRYDTAASILPVAPSAVELNSVSCVAPGSQAQTQLSAASSLVAVAPTGQKPNTPLAGSQTLYTINAGTLYQLVVPLDESSGKTVLGTVSCGALSLPNVVSVVSLATAGETLFILAQQNPTTFEVLIYSPNGTAPSGLPLIKNIANFGVPTTNGAVPTLIAGQGSTTYVAYSMTGGTSGIWIFNGTSRNGAATTISLPHAARSIVATNGTLYAILADGSLGQLNATYSYQSIQVQIQNPLTPTTLGTYTSATPVPTVASSTTGNSSSDTTFGNGATLAADANAPAKVYVGDVAQNRVVLFAASGSDPGLGLVNQFAYGAPLKNMQDLALAANGSVLNVYGWYGSQLASFSIGEPATGN